MDLRQQKHYDELCEIAKARNYKVITPRYEDAKTKLQFQCPDDHIFETLPWPFKKGRSCPKCMGVCPTQAKERFLHQVSVRQYQTMDDYVNTKTKIKLRCDKQHIFSITPSHFMQGQSCPRCGGSCPVQAAENFQYAVSDRKFLFSGIYTNSYTKVELICDNQHNFTITPHNFMKGRGCPRCASVCSIQAKENFLLRISDNKHQLLQNYVNNYTKVSIQCNNQHVFSIIPSSYMLGTGCNICNESSGEQRIREALNYLQIPFEKNYSFAFLPTRKYDFVFVIGVIGVIIEWDGGQHFKFNDLFHEDEKEFKEKQEIDILKTQFVLNYRYKIIRIDYTWLHRNVSDLAAFIHQAILGPDLLIFSNIEMYEWLRNKVIVPAKTKLKIRHNH